MREFFRGWRRKLGVVTLVMACVFMVGWVRSCTIEDVFEFSLSRQPQAIVSSRGKVEWFWFRDYATHSIEPTPDLPAFPWSNRLHPQTEDIFSSPEARWQLEWYGYYDSESGLELKLGAVDYSYLTLPLTLVSAWLLLSKPRPAKPPAQQSS